MKKSLPKIIVVCGPTGSGKTGLAVNLCKKFDGEIINADSRQVYREMDIGTAKGFDGENPKSQCPMPNQILNSKSQTIQGIPVHLVNIVNPNEKYSVGQFKKDAEEAIRDIISRGKAPFIVGGTGLYIDALVENFQLPSDCHPRAPVVLNRKSRIPGLKTKNLQGLIDILKKLDPDALNVVDLKNRRRVERAIEVCLDTGIPFTKQRIKGERQYDVLKLAPLVSLDRKKLYEKINKRAGEMVKEGLEEEVRMLAKKYGWESEAMTGIGYREWREFVGAGSPRPQQGAETAPLRGIIDQIRQDTRNYAKRQMTWFKRDKEINYVYPIKSSKAGAKQFDGVDLKEAEKLVQEFLI